MDDLETFIQTKSAWVSQVTLYSYLKTRMGTRYVLHFDNDEFMSSVNLAKWNIYAVALQDLTFFTFSHLKVNNMGIPEPVSNKIVYPDLILVPLVGFDKNKFRLGYGGGYYDRYIEKIGKFKKFKTIGLSFAFQEIKQLPINKFDKKLDFIITENKIYS